MSKDSKGIVTPSFVITIAFCAGDTKKRKPEENAGVLALFQPGPRETINVAAETEPKSKKSQTDGGAESKMDTKADSESSDGKSAKKSNASTDVSSSPISPSSPLRWTRRTSSPRCRSRWCKRCWTGSISGCKWIRFLSTSRGCSPLPEEVKTDLKAVHARFESLLNCDLKTLEMQYGTFITVAGMEKSKKPDITPAALLKAWLTGPFAQVFKPINALVLIILSIPVASAEAERVFSAMKRIKTDKRVSMSPTMLEDLMWISLNGPPPDQFNYKLAVLAWYGQRKRRMQFTPNYVMQMLKELGWVTMKPVPETCE